MSRTLPHALLVALLTAALAPSPLFAEEIGKIELVLLDEQVIHGSTFQSHNQRVVVNNRGIFAVYLTTRNAEYTAQTWKLVGSFDGGKTFHQVATGVAATNPPVLETDAEGNLYLGLVDSIAGDAKILRLLASEEWRTPHETILPGGDAGKYAMALDPRRRQLVFLSHKNQFYRVGLDGKLLAHVALMKDGPHAVLQYPTFCFDVRGDLLLAWTTSRPEKYLYHDIHAVKSRDGGETWTTLDGQTLELPIVADDAGPAQRLTLDDEFDVHTWLCNMLATRGKMHAMYLAQAQPPRFTYVRYDLATGREDRRVQPEFRGRELSLAGLDGTFSSRVDDPAAPLVAIVRDANRPRLAALVSYDQGDTWSDLAVSDDVPSPYAITGCRELTSDGYAMGVFTDVVEASDRPTGKSRVYFYRIHVPSRGKESP